MRRWTWALAPQGQHRKRTFAARHLVNGTLVLYDVSSAAFEGRHLPAGGPSGTPETG